MLGCPRTCLHSIVTILSRGADLRAGPACVRRTPALAAMAYRVLYVLCANRYTSAATLRYLRQHDFVPRHAQHLPFQPSRNAAGQFRSV